jgi:arylsulfatase A-like enzyme
MKRWTLWLGMMLAAVLPLLASAQAGAKPPNIVLIMSDDMGYSDLACYGGDLRTPNLDALAANGLRFTQFYNTGRCCPTRASLLTGLYPHQAGVGHMMADKGHDGYRGELNRNGVTIAEALRPAGYGTYAVGKWHVTKRINPPREQGKENWPLQRGFDRFYGTISGGGSFYDPNTLTRDNTQISPYADPEYKPDQFYYTDAISDHAARFVREHRAAAADKPFFLYVAYTAAHWPMHALKRDVEKYRGKYDGGYTPVRQARLDRLKTLGLLDPKWTPAPAIGNWDDVPNKEWEARCMEVYAAMVDCMDQGIGRIVDQLRKNGELDNTLILFLQDNGGCAELMGRQAGTMYKTRPDKPPFPPMAPDVLQPDMIPKQTRDGYPIVQGPGMMPGGPDSFVGYGKNWATVSNTPFREYKHWVHEGGISTPLIAHWPAKIPTGRRGRFVKEPAHLIDIMATCIDISGARYPTEVGGKPIKTLEGVTLAPALRGETLRRPEPLFWEHEGNRAVRDGKWKLVAREDQPWELYDMDEDRTETHDLSAKQPERVKELAAKWDGWAARANVLPLGTWKAPNVRQGRQ